MPTILKPGPYTLQFPYVYDRLSHIFEVNCDIIGTIAPGDAPGDITMRVASGDDTVTLDDAANTLWGAIRGFFQPTTLCSSYTLWKRTLTTTERVFMSGGTLSAPNGFGLTANVPAGQATYTYRSAAGGIGKITLLEGGFDTSNKIPMASDTFAPVVVLRSYLLGSDCIVMARDRGFPAAVGTSSYGQNEKVFRRRFRA